MLIPSAWSKATGQARAPNGRELRIAVWGWGRDENAARKDAAERLQRVQERLRRGERFPQRYAYGARPLREEILQVLEDVNRTEPAAVVTRNGYGAQVLSSARLLFLDIDLPPPTLFHRLARLFGRTPPHEAALARLRTVLTQQGATFRIYRTASGFRVMGIDRAFEPAAAETAALMRATGTDPEYARLCIAQASFRARLTPKPWRCGVRAPPGEYPRSEREQRARYAAWLREYETASRKFATCRYLETIGRGRPKRDLARLLDLHDRTTRCDLTLPLA
jgi:hypothetical protein